MVLASNSSIYFVVDELSLALEAHLKLGSLPPIVPSHVHRNESTTTTTTTTTAAAATITNKVKPSSDTKIPIYDRWTLLDDSTIEYGYLSKTGGVDIIGKGNIAADATAANNNDNNETTTKVDRFYITTAINYTNGPAHMGHAYEAATSDVIARYNRLRAVGPVYFVTGSDEHGQKIANTASDQKKEPIDICNIYVTGFQVLNQRIRITNDDYIRTTSKRHQRTAHELWKRCADAGDIYLDTYSGWYNVREETFVTENEAQLADYKDTTTGLPLKQVEEESYFFRMSKYKNKLIEYIESSNPTFIQPEMHKNLILQRLKTDELRDLSISRTTFTWGIPVPEGFNSNHVMYVWVDALSNYLTGVDAFQVEQRNDTTTSLSEFWPASVHIIGKDILWFHTVIWPCLLMSANIPLPKMVFAHGFVNDKDGKKMSKSIGNVIDPHDMLDKFHVDTFRWYLCKEAPYGGELAFSEESMRDMHNADLCDNFGNLVHRAITLCHNDCGGVIPDVPAPTNPPLSDLTTLIDSFMIKMNKFELQSGANIVIQGFRDINGYLQTEEPWKKKGDEYAEIRKIIIRCCLESIYALTHLLLPFIPEGASKVFAKLGTEPVSLKELSRDCRNLKVGTIVTLGDVLYTKSFLSDNDRVDTDGSGPTTTKKKESHADAQRRKKEAKEKAIAASKEGQQKAGSVDDDPDQPDFTKIEIRVGKIVKVWNHPEADKLFCEQIDLNEADGPREIASGLRDYYTLEQMQNRLVLVVCNLKPAKIVGFTSNGMVLAAKGNNSVELIDPPPNSIIGERVTLNGMDVLSYEPVTSTQVKKKKVWETVAKDLITVEDGIATWSGMSLQTTAGPCKAATLVGAPIS